MEDLNIGYRFVIFLKSRHIHKQLTIEVVDHMPGYRQLSTSGYADDATTRFTYDHTMLISSFVDHEIYGVMCS